MYYAGTNKVIDLIESFIKPNFSAKRYKRSKSFSVSICHSFEIKRDELGETGDDDGIGEHDSSASSDAEKDSVVSVFSSCVLLIDFGQLLWSWEPSIVG